MIFTTNKINASWLRNKEVYVTPDSLLCCVLSAGGHLHPALFDGLLLSTREIEETVCWVLSCGGLEAVEPGRGP